MRILGIETSCDETAIAILSGEGDVLTLEKSIVRTQIDIHAAYGGVVPEVAAREHLEVLIPMLREHVDATGRDIDAIAVTVGPGLAPALRVGVEVAKTLALLWGKPLVPVCHMEGHLYAPWLGSGQSKEEGVKSKVEMPKFPVLALLVSGGHTELVLMRDHGQFEKLAETLDDAAGEAFDKVAKMLELGYPGGPKVAALAEKGDAKAFAFPRALPHQDDAFSFSGVKTSVLYVLRERADDARGEQFKADIAASFQEAVVDTLVTKTMKMARKTGAVSVILAGGVAANLSLRERLQKTCTQENIACFVPEFRFSMDNAAMIAAAGYFRFRAGHVADPLMVRIDPNLDIAA